MRVNWSNENLRWPLLIVSVLGVALAGCSGISDARPVAGGYPPDFSLVLVTEPTREQASEGAERWLYILEPDRSLHCASGDGVSSNVYPPRTAVLEPTEMARAHRLAKAALEAAAPEPEDAQPIHRLGMTAGGQRPSVEVPTDQLSPEMRKLADYLTKLRHGSVRF